MAELEIPEALRAVPEWRIAAEVVAERARQDAKWGEQPLPDWPRKGEIDHHVEGLICPEDVAKDACDKAAEAGLCTHAHVLIEEVAEALEACERGDRSQLRRELVQVAAVAQKWIRQLDARDYVARAVVVEKK